MKINNKQLEKEQNNIIYSEEKNIVVLAGPGSGKTYTIIKKALKELEKLKEEKLNKGVILCTFSKDSANELKKRLEYSHIKNEFSFVGTIDSFIYSNIINPFKNRILRKMDKERYTKLITEKLKIREIHSTNKKNFMQITKNGPKNYSHDFLQKYLLKWIDNLYNNSEYELSFPLYLFANSSFEYVPQIKRYLAAKYHSIYIDEAQDLNQFQMEFLDLLVESTEINYYLIGDKNQSIYSFRGSNPELFYSKFKEKGFKEFKITFSIRCHPNILEFSNRFLEGNKNKDKIKNENVVLIKDWINDIDKLNKINDYFILVERNDTAKEIFEKCKEHGINNVVLSKKIDLGSENKEFSDNYIDCIDQILKFFYNHKNSIPKFKYPIENLELFLRGKIGSTKKDIENFNIKKNEDSADYLKKIFNMYEIKIPDQVYEKVREQFKDENLKNNYIETENKNRIMTIHASKGLEAEYVFLALNKTWHEVGDETKRKLFVAFTRAKKRIEICFLGEEYSPLNDYVVEIWNSTFK